MKTHNGMINDYSYRLASVPNQYDNVKVIVGTDEKIYDKVYVSAVIQNRRLVKLLKDSVKYK